MKKVSIVDICKNGHLLDEANAYIWKGFVNCKICRKSAQKKFESKKIRRPRHKPKPMDPLPRFWARVQKTESCWIWTGTRSKSGGYGLLSVNGKYVRAHRFSFELHKSPIPVGLEACHSCDNPPCVNPAHLFSGTHGDNMRDMVSKRRGIVARGPLPVKSHCPNGHALLGDNVRICNGSHRCKECARLYARNRRAGTSTKQIESVYTKNQADVMEGLFK